MIQLYAVYKRFTLDLKSNWLKGWRKIVKTNNKIKELGWTYYQTN